MRKIIPIILFIILLFCSSVNGESIVDSATIENWATSYIDECIKIVEVLEENFENRYEQYINFDETYPYEIKSVISSRNGVAIEITHNTNKSETTFKNVYTEEKIGIAVFENNILNNTIVDIDAYNYMRETNRTNDFMFQFHGSNIVTNGTIFTKSDDGTKNWHFTDMDNSKDFLLINIVIDGVLFEYTYVDNNNSINYWTEEHAKKKAMNHLERILIIDFLDVVEKDEFTELIAYSDLESKILEIKLKLEEKRESGISNYTMYDWRRDLKELNHTAFNTYGVTNEYLQEIIEFLDADIFPPEGIPIEEKESNIENNVYLQYILNAIISTIFIILFIVTYGKKHSFFSDRNKRIFEIILTVLFARSYLYFIFESTKEINFIQIFIPLILAICLLSFTRKEPEIYIRYKRRRRYNDYINEIETNGYANVNTSDAEYYLINYNSEEIQKITDKEILEEFMGWDFNNS